MPEDADAPESFTERILQARLAEFWRSLGPFPNTKYDLTLAEERYERFCSEFIPTLPPAFSLQANKEWDICLSILPLQRQLLYMSIFESICSNFRPVLLLESSDILNLPLYKQVLLSSQRKALAAAALNELDAVATMHALLGSSHTRFASIIFHTFEAAVPLVCLCMDCDFPADGGKNSQNMGNLTSVTRERCMQAADNALSRLQMLAEVSPKADAGARTLSQLLDRVPKLEAPVIEMMHSTVRSWPSVLTPTSDGLVEGLPSLEHSNTNITVGIPSAVGLEGPYPNWELLAMPLNLDYSMDEF
ncbi:MAG: hypothetical protein Q9227_005446 [Pyrenula ochraceoflavens]